jgi:exosortase E/protease (VPEID-CTERM system)
MHIEDASAASIHSPAPGPQPRAPDLQPAREALPAPTPASSPNLIRRIAADPLGRRILAFALLLGADVLAATLRFDGGSPFPRGAWLTGWIHAWSHTVARCLICFAGIFAAFACLRRAPELAAIGPRMTREPVNWRWLAGHVAALTVFAAASIGVFGGRMTATLSNFLSVLWILSGAVTGLCAALAFVQYRWWVELKRMTGRLWIYSAAAAVAACVAAPPVQSLWRPTARLTFRLVQFILRPLVPGLIVQPEKLQIAGPHFGVTIADTCSGLEGIGLLLIFSIVWLIVFRDELRFPHVLALVPAAAVILFLTNGVRIAALLLIGNAGAPEVAAGGFHSQAGWIAFSLVSIGLVAATRHIGWVTVRAHVAAAQVAPMSLPMPVPAAENPVAPFLLPFLGILAAGMLSRAVSGSFEWLYALRLAAAALLLWVFRRPYRSLNWHFGWLGPAAGALIFVFWIAWDHAAPAPMPPALASAPFALTTGWIALRVLGAVITVPIAEELAFRGYLLRRFVSADFEAVPFKAFTWFALAASSLLFGLMHGGQWPAGVAAGVAYGLAAAWRGRIGDAVAAHATSNALLAAYVLIFGQWQLW